MTRMEALEAVATAAIAYFRGGLKAEDYPALLDAVDRLPDPLPAATPGEVVEVALGLWADAYGQTALFRADTVGDGRKAPGWTRLGTIRLALTEDGGDAG